MGNQMLNIYKAVCMFVNSTFEVKYSEYYEGWSGMPNGRSISFGNRAIILDFLGNPGLLSTPDVYRAMTGKERNEISTAVMCDLQADRLADMIRLYCVRHHFTDGRWCYELPILQAYTRLKKLKLRLSPRTIAQQFHLSVPRAEFVAHALQKEEEIA